jgi:hypothetical protein
MSKGVWQKYLRQKDGGNKRAAVKYFTFGGRGKPSGRGSQILNQFSVQQNRTVLWANPFSDLFSEGIKPKLGSCSDLVASSFVSIVLTDPFSDPFSTSALNFGATRNEASTAILSLRTSQVGGEVDRLKLSSKATQFGLQCCARV